MMRFSHSSQRASRAVATRRLLHALLILTGVILVGTLAYTVILDWSSLDALYMTVITVSTIGFKEVRPLDTTGEIITIGLALIGVGTAAYALSSLATFVFSVDIATLIKGRHMQRHIENMEGHIVLCGCGRTGRCALEELLLAQDERVVIIERDPDICEEMAGRGLPVMCEDATAEEVLESARVAHAAGLITALPDDADNVFVALTAREMAPDLLIIARASAKSNEHKLRRAGANRVIMVNEVAGRHMAQILLQPETIRFVDRLTGLHDREIGLREVEVSPGCAWDGVTIAEANIRAQTGLTVMAIRRHNGELIINPRPDEVMQAHDVVIVFGPRDRAEGISAAMAAKADSQ
jgi:voltage-gated potassium channel